MQRPPQHDHAGSAQFVQSVGDGGEHRHPASIGLAARGQDRSQVDAVEPVDGAIGDTGIAGVHAHRDQATLVPMLDQQAIRPRDLVRINAVPAVIDADHQHPSATRRALGSSMEVR